jgi:hypothetical protein
MKLAADGYLEVCGLLLIRDALWVIRLAVILKFTRANGQLHAFNKTGGIDISP